MIYFDNSATTKPYKEVIDSFVTVSNQYYGNPSSLHGIGVQAEKLLEQAREQMAKLLGVKAKEVYFTSGGTESNNLAIKGTALWHKNRGRHIITTSVEHDSVSNAMAQLEKEGFEITYVPVGTDGRIQVKDVLEAIKDETILVSIMHVNNEVGAIQPVEEIGWMLKKFPSILFHVDAVQSIGKLPLSLHESRVDFCSISAHKFHGLKGSGALFIRDGVKLSPLLSGGNQEKNLRSGTENVAGAVAMAKALRLTLETGKQRLDSMKLSHHLLRTGLSELDGITIHTPYEYSAPHILNFSVQGIKSEVFVHALEEKGIFVSTTSACSSKKKLPSKTLLAMGVAEAMCESSVRISLSFKNTIEEAKIALTAIDDVIKQLRKVMK